MLLLLSNVPTNKLHVKAIYRARRFICCTIEKRSQQYIEDDRRSLDRLVTLLRRMVIQNLWKEEKNEFENKGIESMRISKIYANHRLGMVVVC